MIERFDRRWTNDEPVAALTAERFLPSADKGHSTQFAVIWAVSVDVRGRGPPACRRRGDVASWLPEHDATRSGGDSGIVTSEATDQGRVMPLLDAVEQAFKAKPEVMVEK